MYRFQPVLELLRYKSVKEFQEVFGEVDGSDKGISFDTFKALLKSKLCREVREYDARHLFCQIDRYSEGNITQAALVNYLEVYEKKRLLPPIEPFENTPTMYPGVRCQDCILEWTLYPEEPDLQDEMAGHYISASRSGILSVWTREMTKRFDTTIETVDDGATGKSTTWATSLTCLPREKLLAVSTTAGDIRFFRTSIYKFEHRFSIVCLPFIILRLNCFASEKLVCGDFSGSVYILQFKKDFFARNRMRGSHLPPEKLLFEHLKIGKVAGLAYVGTNKLHFSPVQKVEYIRTLNAIISCSMNTKRAMMVHFQESNESLCFTSAGGINCFAFCERLNCVITGGSDHAVKIWNAMVNTSYNESLAGHSSPVKHMVVMEERLLLVSCDSEKTLRVWNLLRPQCLQVINFQESEFPGKQSFSSMFLDPVTGSLILTTYRIGKLDLFQTTYRDKTHPNSEYIMLAAFSEVYNCLVTVGNAGTVAVWDAETGSLIYEYDRSHEILNSDSVPQNNLVMAAGLDPSSRRLITADRIGMIKVWNFHLGVCLQSFETHCIILSLSFVGFHIYAAGSSEVVIDLYDNGSEYVDPVVWENHHRRSIVSLDHYRRNLVVSASGDGKIVVWLRKSMDAKVHLQDLKDEDEKEVKVNKDYLSKTEIDKRRKCGVSQLLFLQKREMDYFVGNLVSCGMNGKISFWNIVCTQRVNDGKLLSKFRAVSRACDGVLCLATDPENRYLISGDTMGYVRVYELDNYYAEYGSAPPRSQEASEEQFTKFPFLRLRRIMKKQLEHLEIGKDDEPDLGFRPFLLNCYRAHLGAVLKVSYINEKEMLVTAGRERSVRLWTLSGVYVGRLGTTDEPWSFTAEKKRKSQMPPDIRAVASSTTLFVLNNGNTPIWTRALEALKRCRLGHQPEGFSKKPVLCKLKESHSEKDLSSYGGTLEEELAQRLPYFRGTRACKQKFFEEENSER